MAARTALGMIALRASVVYRPLPPLQSHMHTRTKAGLHDTPWDFNISFASTSTLLVLW